MAGGANGALPGLEPALQAALVLPLRARGRRLGALVRGATDARRLGDEELEAGRGPGRRGALAIDGARLPAPRRHVAETLQASLLPEALSEVDGQEGPLRDAAAVAVALVR